MILTFSWMKQTKKPNRIWSVIRLKKFNDFPVLISWTEGEDIKIEFTDPGEHDEDEIRDEVMRIINQELGEIADADI